MTDYFALLQQPRRPWLDDERVKQQFLSLSADAHPDRVHVAPTEAKAASTKRFTELNAAYNCLKEPRDRLRHLVELELGHKPGDLNKVPNELADAFMKIATACRTTEQLVTEKVRIQSPLLQARFFERVQPHLVNLETLQEKVGELLAQATQQLRTLDAAWNDSVNRAALLPQIEALSQVLGFLVRWRSQLQEGQFRLTLQ